MTAACFLDTVFSSLEAKDGVPKSTYIEIHDTESQGFG